LFPIQSFYFLILQKDIFANSFRKSHN